MASKPFQTSVMSKGLKRQHTCEGLQPTWELHVQSVTCLGRVQRGERERFKTGGRLPEFIHYEHTHFPFLLQNVPLRCALLNTTLN